MSADQPQAVYEVASGAQRGSRFTVYANRLVQEGRDAVEVVPLSHLASVRVAFERDGRKLNWAIALFAIALVLALASGPLRTVMMELAAKVSPHAGRESIEAVLLGTFNLLALLARLLFPLALILAAIGLALLVFFWLGQTRLTLAFAGTERVCAVLGRDLRLFDFAHALHELLAARKA